MPIVFTMTSRMIVIVSACALLLYIVVFMAGMQVGARLDAHAGNVDPAGVMAAAVSASPTAAWPAALASGASSSNNSGEQ